MISKQDFIKRKCRSCSKTKILAEYPNCKHCSYGKDTICKKCKKKIQKKYREENKEDIKEYRKKYYKQNNK